MTAGRAAQCIEQTPAYPRAGGPAVRPYFFQPYGRTGYAVTPLAQSQQDGELTEREIERIYVLIERAVAQEGNYKGKTFGDYAQGRANDENLKSQSAFLEVYIYTSEKDLRLLLTGGRGIKYIVIISHGYLGFEGRDPVTGIEFRYLNQRRDSQETLWMSLTDLDELIEELKEHGTEMELVYCKDGNGTLPSSGLLKAIDQMK